jgi:hypothetical protein
MRNARRTLLLLFVTALGCPPAPAQQAADTTFNPAIAQPAYREGGGPVVLLDEAHENFHTAEGRYLAFARLLRRDGYVVQPHRAVFSRRELERGRILVIANALAKENRTEWVLPTPSAFDTAEIAAVREWVRDGGSLLLIADHMPFPGAAEELATQFGILMGNGFALLHGTNDGRVVHSRIAGSLADHPVTRGRNSDERVDSVVSFTGQAFRLEADGTPLMTLGHDVVLLMPEVAWQFSRLTPALSASGMLQGAVLRFGKGRVAVFGEAAMFSAQIAGPNRVPMGMNDPAAPQNSRFLLNVIHWLDGLL